MILKEKKSSLRKGKMKRKYEKVEEAKRWNERRG